MKSLKFIFVVSVLLTGLLTGLFTGGVDSVRAQSTLSSAPEAEFEIEQTDTPLQFRSPACGIVQDMGNYTAEELAMINKSVCFTSKLVANPAVIKPIVAPNLKKANSTRGCQGLTKFWDGGRNSRVYLFKELPKSERALVSLNNIGVTVLHEFHHYWLDSRDDGSSNDPKNLIDDPAMDGFLAALNVKLPETAECTIENESARMKTRAHQFACDCGIKYWQK